MNVASIENEAEHMPVDLDVLVLDHRLVVVEACSLEQALDHALVR
jgi:hypothetical protein